MRVGKKNGEGIFYYLDGRIFKGSWKENEISGYGCEEGSHFYEG